MVGVVGVPTEDRGIQSNGGFLVPTLLRGNAYDSLDRADMVGVVEFQRRTLLMGTVGTREKN